MLNSLYDKVVLMAISTNTEQLTIFYDGHCPMCMAEMQHLKRHDAHNLIDLVSVHQGDFVTEYPQIDFNYAMKVLHGSYQGRTLLGLEVTHRAWTLVGKGFWVAPLNWPVIKSIAHGVYLIVAHYRHPISRYLSRTFGIGKENCQSGTCDSKPVVHDHQRKK
jgi:predicted DCC family thiol-disulfide oxidoreductase YuxK